MCGEDLGLPLTTYTDTYDHSVEPHSKMVSPTFSSTPCLHSLLAPPQRMSQVTASVGAAFPCTTISYPSVEKLQNNILNKVYSFTVFLPSLRL